MRAARGRRGRSLSLSAGEDARRPSESQVGTERAGHPILETFHTRNSQRISHRVHPHVRHTPCFTSHFIPSLDPTALPRSVEYIARSVFSRRGRPPNERGAALSRLCRLPIAPIEDGRLALLVLPVEVDLDGVRLDEDVDDPSRGLEAALTR